MTNPFNKVKKGVRSMESSLQRFGHKIRQNIREDDADYKAGNVGAGARNPLRGVLKKGGPSDFDDAQVRSDLKNRRFKK